MKPITLVQIRSEIGAGTRGSSLGPSALMIADLKEQVLLDYEMEVLPETIRGMQAESKFPKAKWLDLFTRHTANIIKSIYELIEARRFPIILSGDHGNAFGGISGTKKAIGEATLGIIWIDAHADLHTPFTTPSGNLHGMPLGMAIGEEYGKESSGPLGKKWIELLELGTGVKKIDAKNIAFIGGRAIDTPEQKIIDREGLQNITVDQLREMGIEKAVEASLKAIEPCDYIYISFDVDSMDPSVSTGTGTPVDHGITLEEAMALNSRLVANEKVLAWEMTEINPLLDEKNKMAEAGLKVLYSVLKALKK